MSPPDANSLYFKKLQAIASVGNLEPVFHPIVPLPWTGDTLVIHEALARIRTRDGVVLSPGEFFEDGNVDPADLDYVMLRLLPQLLAQHSNPVISINVAPTSLCGTSFFDLLISMVRSRELAPRYIMLEITEDALDTTEDELTTLDRIEHLRGEGIQVALDQFGDGGNGIRRISQCHFDMIKMSTVIDIATHRGRVLAEYLIAMFKRLSSPELSGDLQGGITRVCFETIETPKQLDQAIYLGANYVQGYLLGAPDSSLLHYDDLVARIDHVLNQFIYSESSEPNLLGNSFL